MMKKIINLLFVSGFSFGALVANAAIIELSLHTDYHTTGIPEQLALICVGRATVTYSNGKRIFIPRNGPLHTTRYTTDYGVNNNPQQGICRMDIEEDVGDFTIRYIVKTRKSSSGQVPSCYVAGIVTHHPSTHVVASEELTNCHETLKIYVDTSKY